MLRVIARPEPEEQFPGLVWVSRYGYQARPGWTSVPCDIWDLCTLDEELLRLWVVERDGGGRRGASSGNGRTKEVSHAFELLSLRFECILKADLVWTGSGSLGAYPNT